MRALLLGMCAVVSCRAAEPRHELESELGAAIDAIVAVEAEHAAEDEARDEERRVREATKDPPPGYLLATPTARSDTSYGNVVLLTEPLSRKVLPIFVSGTEALSIERRLEKRKFVRPLTHDLLDAAVQKLGARVVRAQVDALRDGVYIGTVVLVRGGDTFALDARPSDAMALAIGNEAPIYVSKKLLDQAGIAASELDSARPRPEVAPVAL